MATETASVPVNGNYGPHQAQTYGSADISYANPSTNSNSTPAGYAAAQPSAGSTAGTGSGTADIPKAEVGWYFVERYYTTLSRSPEKVHVSFLWVL